MDIKPRAPGEPRLYEMSKKRVPAYWQFCYLSPTEDAIATKTRKQLTNEDAAFAWCTKCSKKISFNTGNHGVGTHMHMEHRQDLEEFEKQAKLKEQAKKKRRLTTADLSLAEPPAKRVMMKPSTALQLKHDKMLALWIAKDMRPVSAVDGTGFRAYTKFLTEEGGLNFAIPGRTRVSDLIKEMANDLRDSLDAKIAAGCEDYSLTTDLWTDRSLRSFISTTLHYIDDDFNSFNWVLGVEPFRNKHDNERIANALDSTLQRRGLSKGDCTMLLRDGGSNVKKAAEKMKVPHMSCFAHSIHLVVGGALVRKPKPKVASVPDPVDSSAETVASSRDLSTPSPPEPHGTNALYPTMAESTVHDAPLPDGWLDDADGIEELLDVIREEACNEVESYLDTTAQNASSGSNRIQDEMQEHMEALASVRAIVADFRKAAVYFHRSSKAKDRLEDIQKPPGVKGATAKQVTLDCPTRWNSTYDMLCCFLDMKPHIVAFKSHLKTRAGMKEFDDHKSFPDLSDRHWLVAACLGELLRIFAVPSKLLGAQDYPTLVKALPILRIIRRDLQKPNLYAELAASVPHGSYINEVVGLMERVQKAMLKLFNDRFQDTNSDLAWVSTLDPRYATMTYFSESERELAKDKLVDVVIQKSQVSTPSTPPTQSNRDAAAHQLTPVSTDVRLLEARMQGIDTVNLPPMLERPADNMDAMLRIECDDEVTRYLRRAEDKRNLLITAIQNNVRPSPDVEAEMKMGALEWWKTFGALFPRMRKLARKWLGCVATSVPSERAFSTSGYVVSARRCKLKPKFVEDLMFIAHNFEH